jgi:fructosamine-3-kinase
MSQRWAGVAASIARATGQPFVAVTARASGGGSVNRGCQLSDGARTYFVKLNRPGLRSMFEAEAEGLNALAATGAVRVPRPICCDEDEASSWLVLEYLELGRPGDAGVARLGRGLAALHAHRADGFGWHRDNTIGSTPQRNPWTHSWPQFWRDQRLAFQLELAARNGYGRDLGRGDTLLADLPRLFADHAPAASLLHGDLWAGNAGFTTVDEPVLFDPACYYGDREADLAMTELFGGFAPGFYAAYREVVPVPPGYSLRRDLYNLYHVLNHLNLFGGAYLGQAAGMIDRLLAEIG